MFLSFLFIFIFFLCRLYCNILYISYIFQSYLQRFGFLPEPNPEAGTIFTREEFEKGIRNFQNFYGLPETGTFDGETQRLMSLPRCGVKDVLDGGSPSGLRYRRYAYTGTRWEKNELTYRLVLKLKDHNWVFSPIGHGVLLNLIQTSLS